MFLLLAFKYHIAMHNTAFCDIIQTFQLLSPVCAFDVYACGTVRSTNAMSVSLKLTMVLPFFCRQRKQELSSTVDPSFGVYYPQGHQGDQALPLRPLRLVGKTTQIHVQACLSHTQ